MKKGMFRNILRVKLERGKGPSVSATVAYALSMLLCAISYVAGVYMIFGCNLAKRWGSNKLIFPPFFSELLEN